MLHAMPDSDLPDPAALAAVLAVESIKGFGPQKFRELHDAGLTAADVLSDPAQLPIGGKRGETFRASLHEIVSRGRAEFQARARKQIDRAREYNTSILLHGHPSYPVNLWRSNAPLPVLYVRGDLNLLARTSTVACVGSRKIRDRYADRQREFAGHAAHLDWVIVSGFATGADAIAHEAARDADGATICVMPCGLDRPFPPENKALWQDFQSYPRAVLLSEFAFGTAAAKLTLQKRNKTIVALSRGVLVGQSSDSGGAMNAYRFAKEQSKPAATFADDGTDDTSGNRTITRDGDGTAFAVDRGDHAEWERWLQKLSSST